MVARRKSNTDNDVVIHNPNHVLLDCNGRNTRGDQVVCRVLCRICAQDSTLFGDGVFEIYRPALRKSGEVSCGCSGHYRWSTAQYLERLRRECVSLDYSLVGHEPELNAKSVIELLCHCHGVTWKTTVWTFLGVGNFCKECTKEKLRSKFYKGEDAATKEVHKALSSTPHYTLVGWVDGYNNVRSKLELHCSIEDAFGREHGSTLIPFIKFMSRGQRCRKCSSGGFKLTKPANVYVFKVCGDYKFCGYGITNNFKDRLRGHRHTLKRVSSKIESMYVVNVSGEKAWAIEKAIMENFSKESQPISGFVKEATNYNNYQDVCDFVDSLVLQGS